MFSGLVATSRSLVFVFGSPARRRVASHGYYFSTSAAQSLPLCMNQSSVYTLLFPLTM
ncbi:hypothetical protein RSAG8_13500, partial [Rhizoctonia solani AG-8 WAC10335]